MKWTKKVSASALDFLTVQLFINFITWPLFLWWGLSITPLSIIGNLVFSPFLTTFLLLSSCIAFCELCMLPNRLFCWLLEHLTTFWLKIVGYNVSACTIAFTKPPLMLVLCIPICALFIMLHKKNAEPYQRLIGLVVAYFVFSGLFILISTPEVVHIPYGARQVTVKKIDQKLKLIDPGFARRTASLTTWINYTLLPELAKNFGTQSVDTIVLEKKTPSATRCAELLRKKGIARDIEYNVYSK